MSVHCIWKKGATLFSTITLAFLGRFYSAAVLLAMQSSVLATAIPSIHLFIRPSHAGILSRRMMRRSCEVR